MIEKGESQRGYFGMCDLLSIAPPSKILAKFWQAAKPLIESGDLAVPRLKQKVDQQPFSRFQRHPACF